ncbi:FAD-dependent oxidoreductase [bacterium]|nr:FAD-dependent oxidoreductase [bacterium]
MGQKGSEKNDFENERERETLKTNREEDFDDDIIIFDVAILGAGMSGVSCAREICFALNDDDEKNARKVALLEAHSTVGGRCKQTKKIAKWPVELGAEFIHGEVKNPVKDLLAETMRREEDLEEDLDGKKGTPKRMQCSAFEWPDRYAMNTTTTNNSNTEEKEALLYSFSKKSMLVLRDGDECEKNDKDVWKIHQLFDRLPGVSKTSTTTTTTHNDEPEEDEMSSLSALEWLRDVQKCTEREIRVAELIYATDFGASLKDIGMREIMIEKERWENGEQYLVMNGGFNELFRRAFLNAFQRNSNSNSNSNNSPVVNIDVRLNWEVETVEKVDERNLIKVTGRTTTTETSEKKTLYAKKVVVSLPLPMYRPTDDDDSDDKKLSRVTFHPPLSEEKRKALRAVKMGNAVKVLLGFNEKFWPQENLFNVICDHPAPFPEFWVVSDKEKTIYSDEDDNNNNNNNNNNTNEEEESKKEEVRFVITFFVTGDRANAMAKIDPNERIEMAFQQFVWITMRITNDDDDGRKEFDRIREKHLKTSETKAWSEDKFAGGSYTHPSVGCDRKTRDLLAKSEWSDCLFFCGEGTNASVNPCLQGAFETGVRAGKEVLESLKLQ